ncbi:MAG: tyrosine--tRNA ligase [Phycisphaerales bacterium]
MPKIDFLSEMKWRGLVHQCTDEAALAEHLASPRRAYVGFDPTADSLTIGNLVGIMALTRFQMAGHAPVAVMGGGTGLIGDPSGKTAERPLRTRDEIAENVRRIQTIFERIWRHTAEIRGVHLKPPAIVNNLDWLGHLSYLDALRDIGKHFSVNMMIQKDSVRERLHNRDQGISYTEFSYMLLQAYDFAHLFETAGVTIQMGGSDQYGNIVCGVDLARRRSGAAVRSLNMPSELIPGLLPVGAPLIVGEPAESQCHGLTWPLVTKADGTKFGKTESGAIWLTARDGPMDDSPSRTSPYAYYQFWLNAADAEVIRFMKIYTHMTQAEIATLEASHAADPGKREAHRALARGATWILHGKEEMEQAEAAAKALFSGDVSGLSIAALNEVFASVPASTHSRSALEGDGASLVELLPQTSLAKSKSEARQFLGEGSISINGAKAAADARLTSAHLLHGSIITLRKGKKNWHVTRWE